MASWKIGNHSELERWRIDTGSDSQTIAVQDNDYLSRADAAVSFPDAKGRVFLMPRAEVAERTFGKLMDDGVRQGMTAFEIDFMEKNFEAVPYLRDTAGAADGVLVGLSRAAAARGLPTQLCSDSPRDVIAAAAMPAVTQFRGSLDYACDCSAEPLSGNWDVGQQTLLISSLGLGASKDTFMTQGEEKGINHRQAPPSLFHLPLLLLARCKASTTGRRRTAPSTTATLSWISFWRRCPAGRWASAMVSATRTGRC